MVTPCRWLSPEQILVVRAGKSSRRSQDAVGIIAGQRHDVQAIDSADRPAATTATPAGRGKVGAQLPEDCQLRPKTLGQPLMLGSVVKSTIRILLWRYSPSTRGRR
jgi:hypothetical protein